MSMQGKGGTGVVTPAKYLVDTDWAVYYLRGKEPYVTHLKKYLDEGLGISVISLAKLYEGEGVFRASNWQEKECPVAQGRQKVCELTALCIHDNMWLTW